MADEKQEVSTTKTVSGTVGFNPSAPSPIWATWIFRIVFLLTMVATIIIAGDTHIPNDIKVRIFLYMKGFDVFVWGVAKGLGVKKKDFEDSVA